MTDDWTELLATADEVARRRASRRAAGDPAEVERYLADADANDPDDLARRVREVGG